MRLIQTIGYSFAFFVAALLTTPVLANELSAGSDSLAMFLPQGALAAVEIAKMETVIDRIETGAGLKAILETPQWREIAKQEPIQKAMAGKAIAEAQLGMSLWQFAKTYFGDRVVLGIYPPSQSGGQPDGVLIIRVKNAESLEKLWERVSPLLPLAGNKFKVSCYEGGGRLVTVDDGHQIVIRDRWIVLSKVRSLVDSTLRLLTATHATEMSVADTVAWKTMSSQIGTNHEIQFCVDMQGLNTLAGHRIIPTKLDNGMVSLLLGGYLELAANSPYFGSTVDIGENHVAWRTAVAGEPRNLDSAHRPFVLEGDRVLQAVVPDVKNPLNGFSLARDFAGWYRNREALLDPSLLPAFDKFETGIATFLSGRNFGEDVLPTLGQRLTIVTAPQSFDHLKGKPGVQLPGVAIILDLAKPSEAHDFLNVLFQTIILVSNLQASQEGRQPFVLSSESYRDTQIAFAKYLKQPEGASLPISLNFQPASARIGSRFVMTTNVAMCRQMIDLIQAESPAANPVTPPSTDSVQDVFLNLSPTIAAELLEANASVLQAQSIQQGKSTEQSAAELKAVLDLLRKLTPLTFKSTRHADRWDLELRVGWK